METMKSPRLVATNEMDDFDGLPEMLKGRKIAVGGAKGEIVAKGESP